LEGDAIKLEGDAIKFERTGQTMGIDERARQPGARLDCSNCSRTSNDTPPDPSRGGGAFAHHAAVRSLCSPLWAMFVDEVAKEMKPPADQNQHTSTASLVVVVSLVRISREDDSRGKGHRVSQDPGVLRKLLLSSTHSHV